MSQIRRRTIFLGLVGLCLLIGLALSSIWLSGFWRADEPTYQGKPVSVWFTEYAYATNVPLLDTRALATGTLPDGRGFVLQQNGAGRPVTVLGPTNAAARTAWLREQMTEPRDRPGEALKALGTNAVPHLVSQLRGSMFDQPYTMVFTNLPLVIRKKLPDPQQKIWLRIRTLDALRQLGEPARSAAPSVLALLTHRNPSLRNAALTTLRTLPVDRRTITGVLLRLGDKRRYREVVEIASQTNWEGDEMVRLLAKILKSPDPTLRRQAMALLERAGPAAAPAMDGILLAMTDSDWEVRYLAARSLEAIGTNSPAITNALLASLADEKDMVRNVSRRALAKIAPDALPQVSR